MSTITLISAKLFLGLAQLSSVFFPFVVETLGGWHEVASQTIQNLGAALARSTGQDEEDAIKHLFGRLGILLVRGITSLILNRTPTVTDTIVNGEL